MRGCLIPACVSLLVCCLLGGVAFGQSICGPDGCTQDEFFDVPSSTGAAQFAADLNDRGALFHDRQFRGAEVLYQSSGPATPTAAHAAWQNSPGHRRLVNSGQITDVACVGNVCVGRGSSTAIGWNQPVRNTLRKSTGFVRRTFQRFRHH